MFFEAAATAATVVWSGCSVSVVLRQFVTTYNRKDKIGRLLFLPTLLSLIIICEKVAWIPRGGDVLFIIKTTE